MRRTTLAALAALAPACAAPGLAVEPHFVQGGIGGELGDVESLGLERDEGTFGLRDDFRWAALYLSLDLQDSTRAGDGRPNADLSRDRLTIPAGTAVRADLDPGLDSGDSTFDLIPADFELGVEVVDLDFRVAEPLSGASIGSDEWLPAPLLAGRAGVELGRLDLEALLGGTAYDFGGDTLTIFDGHASGRYRVLGCGDTLIGSLVAGLRYVLVDAETTESGDEVAGNLEILGPFAGLRLQF